MKFTAALAIAILGLTVTALPLDRDVEHAHFKEVQAEPADNNVDAAATRAGWLYIKERDVEEAQDNNVDAAATRADWLYIKRDTEAVHAGKAVPSAEPADNNVDAAATRAGWLYIKERDVEEAQDNNVDAAATRAGWLYIKERNAAEKA
ncbi:hypothetical protein PG997_001669 [Apiospora hydei]|uniref:Mating factor alpha n=1 Tax=Apiospora hydei TaxID=1337664 RepID=A0ABR1XEH1_9PEZI